MHTRKFNVHNLEAVSQDDSAKEAMSQDDTASQGALSPDDINKNPCIKIPLSKKQEPVAASCLPLDRKKNKSAADAESRSKAFNWLVKTGFKPKVAIEIAENFTIEEIQKASEYTQKKTKGITTIGNPLGYFKKTLINRYWE